jgi:hypothetical protein
MDQDNSMYEAQDIFCRRPWIVQDFIRYMLQKLVTITNAAFWEAAEDEEQEYTRENIQSLLSLDLRSYTIPDEERILMLQNACRLGHNSPACDQLSERLKCYDPAAVHAVTFLTDIHSHVRVCLRRMILDKPIQVLGLYTIVRQACFPSAERIPSSVSNGVPISGGPFWHHRSTGISFKILQRMMNHHEHSIQVLYAPSEISPATRPHRNSYPGLKKQQLYLRLECLRHVTLWSSIVTALKQRKASSTFWLRMLPGKKRSCVHMRLRRINRAPRLSRFIKQRHATSQKLFPV